MKLFCASLFFLLLPSFVQAQLVKPSILNSGGGTTANSEWSIGEAASIATFKSSNLVLVTGLLQPNLNIVTSLSEYGPEVFGDQISISPNPSVDIVKILFKMKTPGKAIVTILNSNSILYKKLELTNISIYDNRSIILNDLPTGVFFCQILFESTSAKPKKGIYKIVRL